MSDLRIHLVGAGGYAASELLRLLARHPHARLVTIESQSAAGKRVYEVFPALARDERVLDGPGAALAAVRDGDIVVLAGGADVAREAAPRFRAAGTRVLDLSDAFRVGHDDAVYGWPERYRDAIARATLVANPGCYPMTTLLALWPLARFADAIANVIIDAKSGITGSGRNPSVASLYAEVDGDVRAYGLGGHRHQHELTNEMRAMGVKAPYAFSPHVVPLARGMLADVYAVTTGPLDLDEVRAAFTRAYDGSPFVQVLGPDRAPSLAAVRLTNDAQLAIVPFDGGVRIIGALDNLGKGAAGNAVQNLNLMAGLPEETGLVDRTAVH